MARLVRSILNKDLRQSKILAAMCRSYAMTGKGYLVQIIYLLKANSNCFNYN